MVKTGPHAGCPSWWFILSTSATGTATSWAPAATGTISKLILVSNHHNAKPLPHFVFKIFLIFFYIFKIHFYIFIYYFLFVAILIPSKGREMYLLPKNKNWKILLLKIAESFDTQELFPNESLTWIMSHLYSKSVFCVTCSISLTACWWKGSLVMRNLWKVYLLRLFAPCHLSIIILAFYYIFFPACSQFLFLTVLQSLFTACLSYKYIKRIGFYYMLRWGCCIPAL